MPETVEAPTVELPEKLYIVLHYGPRYGRVVPLMAPFEGIGFGMPVFSEWDLATEFIASPNADVPCQLHEISMENFVCAGELPIDMAKEHDTENEYFYMVDPRPMHEWDCLENMGFLIPMRDAAEVLRPQVDEASA
jgi:hypothetical protein